VFAVTPAANIRARAPREASCVASSSGSTNAPTGSSAKKTSPIDSMSMSSTRQRSPCAPSWITIAPARPATISGATDSGRKSLTPGMMRKFCGCWIAEGCAVENADRADEMMSANDATIATRAPPRPRLAAARQNRFGAASRPRKARPRRVRRVNTGPETLNASGRTPLFRSHIATAEYARTPVSTQNNVFITVG
jgi:hypothetical protein